MPSVLSSLSAQPAARGSVLSRLSAEPEQESVLSRLSKGQAPDDRGEDEKIIAGAKAFARPFIETGKALLPTAEDFTRPPSLDNPLGVLPAFMRPPLRMAGALGSQIVEGVRALPDIARNVMGGRLDVNLAAMEGFNEGATRGGQELAGDLPDERLPERIGSVAGNVALNLLPFVPKGVQAVRRSARAGRTARAATAQGAADVMGQSAVGSQRALPAAAPEVVAQLEAQAAARAAQTVSPNPRAAFQELADQGLSRPAPPPPQGLLTGDVSLPGRGGSPVTAGVQELADRLGSQPGVRQPVPGSRMVEGVGQVLEDIPANQPRRVTLNDSRAPVGQPDITLSPEAGRAGRVSPTAEILERNAALGASRPGAQTPIGPQTGSRPLSGMLTDANVDAFLDTLPPLSPEAIARRASARAFADDINTQHAGRPGFAAEAPSQPLSGAQRPLAPEMTTPGASSTPGAVSPALGATGPQSLGPGLLDDLGPSTPRSTGAAAQLDDLAGPPSSLGPAAGAQAADTFVEQMRRASPRTRDRVARAITKAEERAGGVLPAGVMDEFARLRLAAETATAGRARELFQQSNRVLNEALGLDSRIVPGSQPRRFERLAQTDLDLPEAGQRGRPSFMDEAGGVNPRLLATVAGAGAGGAAGFALADEGDRFTRGALGALGGAGLVQGVSRLAARPRRPAPANGGRSDAALKALARVRSEFALSGGAIPKNLVNAAGATIDAALEMGSLKPIKEAFRLPTNTRNFLEATRNPIDIGVAGQLNPTPSSGLGRALPSRLISGVDSTVMQSLKRAGRTSAQIDDALLRRPLTQFVSKTMADTMQHPLIRQLVLFQKTAANQFGTGAQRIVETMPRAAKKLIAQIAENGGVPSTLARRNLTRASLPLGAAAAGASRELTDDPRLRALLFALATASRGPNALPFAVGGSTLLGADAVRGMGPVPDFGFEARRFLPGSPSLVSFLETIGAKQRPSPRR